MSIASTGFDKTIYKLEIPTDDPSILEQTFRVLQDWGSGLAFARRPNRKGATSGTRRVARSSFWSYADDGTNATDALLGEQST